MNDEEKKAIEYWKTHMEILHCNTQLASEHYIKIIVNLIEKQQKEIEKLKSKKYILNAETNEIKEIPISENYISKDKIKELREIDNIDLIQFKLKELLGE